MHCLRCGDCCRETEMLLSLEDITRLEEEGYSRDFFVLFDKEGYAKLRNLQRHCVFFDVENQRCKVYKFRPMGCRLYPIIYHEDKGLVVDEFCRAKGKLNEKRIARKGAKVLRFLEMIDAEAKGRSNTQ
jgi:Fe-S-cluster containining protein